MKERSNILRNKVNVNGENDTKMGVRKTMEKEEERGRDQRAETNEREKAEATREEEKTA